MKSPEEIPYLLAVHKCLNLTKPRFSLLKSGFESWEKVFNASEVQLMGLGLKPKATKKFSENRKKLDLEKLIESLKEVKANVLCLGDNDFPESLSQLYSPPTMLFVRGNWTLDLLPTVAVVGTRRMSRYGNKIIKELIAQVAEKGITITSGLAMGVDAAAHEVAMNNNGKTIGVLGSGIDQITPASSQKTGFRILKEDKGVVMSEYFPGVPARAEHFPHRNRLVAGLGKAVIVVEASDRSGSQITARLAGEQGKDVFAVPGSIFDWGTAGTNKLILKGMAEPLLDISQVFETFGLDKASSQKAVQQKLPLSEIEGQILKAFGVESKKHINDLIEDSGLSGQAVSSFISVLELKGYVEHVGAQVYAKKI